MNTNYISRKSRHAFIADRFRSYLSDKILNIGGGGKKYLLEYIDPKEYLELDVDGQPDLNIDLDRDFPLPIENNRFDVVLCTDVLEHLEEFHQVFSELLRVSNRYVIISLPNALTILPSYLRRNIYTPIDGSQVNSRHGLYTKFYGLPMNKPLDRHRWFFSYTEAKKFFRFHANEMNYRIVEEFAVGIEGVTWRSKLLRKILHTFISDDLFYDLFAGVYWCVLEKKDASL